VARPRVGLAADHLERPAMSRYLIVGATGRVGRHVLAQLVDRGEAVRALVRNPDAPGRPGVEVVWGDFDSSGNLGRCLRCIDAVFLVWTAPPATVAACVERIAIQARRIVFLSVPLKTAPPLW
jgi:uncharacterized protein YbjT (DUF2867 family)